MNGMTFTLKEIPTEKLSTNCVTIKNQKRIFNPRIMKKIYALCLLLVISQFAKAVNTAPSFLMVSPQVLTICQNAAATDIIPFIHVSDVDAAQTETWTVLSGPSNGTLNGFPATAASGTANIMPAGPITYLPNAGYNGSDAFTIQVSDGTATATMLVNVTVSALPIITVQPANTTTCEGTNPIFSVTAAGGGLTYQWMENNGGGFLPLSNGAMYSGVSTNSLTITGVTIGMNTYTYECVVSGTCPVASGIATLTVDPLPTANAGGSPAICQGQVATIAGATGTNGTFSWTTTGAGTFQFPTSLTAKYNSVAPDAGPVKLTLTTTSNNTCGSATATAFFNLIVKALPSVSISPSVNPICSGGTGTTMTANGASTYQWTAGPATSAYAVNPAATATYTVTGTSALSSCSNTATQVITVSQLPTASGGTTTNACSNTTGTVFGMTATPASAAISWVVTSGAGSITSGGTTKTPVYTCAPADAGTTVTLTMTVTSTDGCAPATATAPFTVVVSGLPTITVTGTTTVCSGTPTVLTAHGANGYSWTAGPALAAYSVSPTAPTTYTVIGFNTGTGCNNTATQLVNVNALPTIGITSNPVGATVCTGSNLTLTGAGAGATGTYTWSPVITNNAAFVPGPVGTQTYTVTGTDINNCSNTNTVSVTVNPLPTINVTASPVGAAVCAGSNLTLAGGGAGLGSYSWSNGIMNNTPFVPAGPLTYTVTGTDGNGCVNTATQAVTINALPAITLSALPANDSVCAGGLITLSGHGGTSYAWSSGVVNNNPFIPAGSLTYTVTGTDGNNCSNTATQLITVDPLPVISVTPTPAGGIVCAGSPAKLNATGASTYVWTGGITNNTAFTPSVSATYTVTGTDVHGCKGKTTQTVVVDSLPVITIATIPSNAVACAGGLVTLNATANQGSTVYTWSGGITNNTAFTPVVGVTTYTVTTTGTNNCMNKATQLVTVHSAPVITVTANPLNATICLGATISLTGHGAGIYSWTGGIANNIGFTPALPATYTVTGTDANGCTGSTTQFVTVHALPVVGVISTPTNDTVCAGGQVTLKGSGATTYSWSTGLVNNTPFSPTNTATYRVTGTDLNGCANDANVTVTVISLPIIGVLATPSNATACAGGQVTLAGMGASTYSWSGGITNNTAFIPAGTATYTLTGTDGHSCTATIMQLVTVHSLPVITITTLPASAKVCAGGQVNLTGGGASNYSWSGGVVDNTVFTPTTSGTYTVTGTDANNCKNTATQAITVNLLPVVGFTENTTLICVDAPSFTLSPGTPAGGTYNGAGVNGSSFSPQFAGTGFWTIAYTVTDANNCTNKATQVIDVSACAGIQEIAEAGGGMNVYPNPFVDGVTVVFGEASQERTISIFDLMGKQIYTSKMNFQSLDVDLSFLPQGIYMIESVTNNESQMKRIVKQ
jgi:hypothetical protein